MLAHPPLTRPGTGAALTTLAPMSYDPSSLVYTAGHGDVEIRASTVLPARRENVALHTEDGQTLVGEIALPARGQPRATLVTLHPLPTHGGFMDSHVYKKASYRLPALAGIAVLRFNTRGTSSPRGTSTGTFDGGDAERHDVAAATAWAVAQGLPERWLVGWSFGSELVLKYGAVPPVAEQVTGGILLSPPLHRAGDADLDRWAESGKPLRVLVPEHDDYLRPEEAARRFARVPTAQLTGVEEAKHLWVGERFVQRVLNEIATTVLGEPVRLPATWSGPTARGG